MLRTIEIKNYALIDGIKIDLDKGLNIITGETGAGKSILLGALGLVMGKRADSKVLYDSEKKCVVEVNYAIHKLHLQSFFESNDLDYEDELIIRREIAPSGKSRAFINDTPTTLAVLEQLSQYLVDLHQQFDTQDIQKASHQMKLLDALADNESLITDYQQDYKIYKQHFVELQELKAIAVKAQEELDYYSFQLQELDEANFTDENQESMESDLKAMESAEEVMQVFANTALSIEENDQSILSQINELISQVSSIAGLKPSYESIYNRLQSTYEELKDIAQESQSLSDQSDINQEDVVILQERLSTLYRLQKKHNASTVEELAAVHEKIAKNVSQFQDIEGEIAKKEALLHMTKISLLAKGDALSKSRKKAGPLLKKQVESLLSELAMENARIEIELVPLAEPGISGLDQVNFLFAANKGGALLPLKKVASGGETSRLALCIKSILASKSALPTMVFDEIDSGVSGEIAQKMGAILERMAEKHQVITITHAPQIASKADQHFYVYKFDTETRTITKIKVLEVKERIEEVAKMMSGDPPSSIALKAAEELVTR